MKRAVPRRDRTRDDLMGAAVPVAKGAEVKKKDQVVKVVDAIRP